MQDWHMLPEQRTAELFRDLHGVHLSAATLGALSRQAADGCRECSERLRDLLAGAKHLDETGFRIARWLTFCHASARRSSAEQGRNRIETLIRRPALLARARTGSI